jgi:hypothetical protein
MKNIILIIILLTSCSKDLKHQKLIDNLKDVLSQVKYNFQFENKLENIPQEFKKVSSQIFNNKDKNIIIGHDKDLQQAIDSIDDLNSIDELIQVYNFSSKILSNKPTENDISLAKKKIHTFPVIVDKNSTYYSWEENQKKFLSVLVFSNSQNQAYLVFVEDISNKTLTQYTIRVNLTEKN